MTNTSLFTCSRRTFTRAALLLTFLSAIGAGCSQIKVEPLTGAPPGTKAEKLTELKSAEGPIDPAVVNAQVVDLEASLRRIVVRYIRYTAFVQSDPQPLLTEEQIVTFARILAAEVPKLSAQQRIRFSFEDRYYGHGFDVVMDVYPEGKYIVYSFSALAANKNMPLTAGDTPQFMGILQRQPGQEVANQATLAWVKDSLVPDEREAATIAEAKQALLEGAKALLEPGEPEHLEALVKRPTPSLDAWKDYWDKRRTLRKARDQGLMDRAAYMAQVDRLNAELER